LNSSAYSNGLAGAGNRSYEDSATEMFLLTRRSPKLLSRSPLQTNFRFVRNAGFVNGKPEQARRDREALPPTAYHACPLLPPYHRSPDLSLAVEPFPEVAL